MGMRTNTCRSLLRLNQQNPDLRICRQAVGEATALPNRRQR